MECLRRAQNRLGTGLSEELIHVVLGGPEPDLGTVAATLCLALHFNLKEQSDGLCVPVLTRAPHQTPLPEETVKFLQRVKIPESLLLWKEDVALVEFHRAGKLSLTLLRDGLLNSSELHVLESSVLEVVLPGVQQDAGGDGGLSAVATVTRKILQEAAEHIRGALGEALGEALKLQREKLWSKLGCRSEELEELLKRVEELVDISDGQQKKMSEKELSQRLTAELREFSDEEITIALTSLNTNKEEWPGLVDTLKSFALHHGYNGVVILLSMRDTAHHPRQQVAVYSSNADIFNQICAELEESSTWSLSRELGDEESLQVYHIPMNPSATSGIPSLLEEEIQDLLKDFVSRRSSVLVCHPSSRTSSTEGVAGSVEYSQGSSGINDMEGSDTEKGEDGSVEGPAARLVADDGESAAVGNNASAEPLSPDSGMTTLRSSRSSKESSVFLSDDSPVGEALPGAGGIAGPGFFLKSSLPLILPSLSPPVPPLRRKHRSCKKSSDAVELSAFDPLHCNDPQVLAREKGRTYESREEGLGNEGSSSLSELEEMRLLDFSASNSLGGLESENSSIDHQGLFLVSEMIDTMVPPTPVNSLAGSRPPSSCGPRFFPEDVIERINGLQCKDSMSSSLSETWDELSFDVQGALSSSSNRTKESETLHDPIIGGSKVVVSDVTEKDGRETSKTQNDHRSLEGQQPQLNLIMEKSLYDENWNSDDVVGSRWHNVSVRDLQLTPPDEETNGKTKLTVAACLSKEIKDVYILTPDTSKDEGGTGEKGVQHLELSDFWAYTAQKGFVKSDSRATTSYPESLDMWNTTIRDDSLSPIATPDNLSENSGSFCLPNSGALRDASSESPVGYSDSGMQMWNTTIQEDSSSATTTPEGHDSGTNLSPMGSLESGTFLETHQQNLPLEENDPKDQFVSKTSSILKGVESRNLDTNVKIVVETIQSEVHNERTTINEFQGSCSRDSVYNLTEDEPVTCQSELSAPGMVMSTSEYDNIGTSGAWSHGSSLDTCDSAVSDMIQLEEQSSPFITFTKSDKEGSEDQVEHREYTESASGQEQSANQMFLFDSEVNGCKGGSIESNYVNINKEDVDDSCLVVEVEHHSPFVFLDSFTNTQQVSRSTNELDEFKINTDVLSSPKDFVSYPSMKSTGQYSALLSNLYVETSQNEGTVTPERQEMGGDESNESVEDDEMENMTVSSDKPHLSTNKECVPRSEEEYINVLVTEDIDGANQPGRQSRGPRKPLNVHGGLPNTTAALKNQSNATHQNYQTITFQRSQEQTRSGVDSTRPDKETQEHDLASCQQANLTDTNSYKPVADVTSPHQSKLDSEALYQLDSRTAENRSHEDETGSVVRSASPSLRFPSDHFLKTREEVYVHSQISMEDSDEGGMSPSAAAKGVTSYRDFHTWGDRLMCQDSSRSSPDPPSCTDSSNSQKSSPAGSPPGELCPSPEKDLGLPFSGDLMEEESEEDDLEEEAGTDCSCFPKWIPLVQEEKEEKEDAGNYDLLSFTDEPIAGHSFRQGDSQTQKRRDVHFDQQPVRLGAHEYSQDLPLRMHQESHQLAPISDPFQWTESQNTSQVQTNYGYNYHHIDQRTENHYAHPVCGEPKGNNQRDATDVYAEFTTNASAGQHESQNTGNYFETGAAGALCSSDDTSFKCQNSPKSEYAGDSACASELYHCQNPAESRAHGQAQDTGDHARYLSEEYVHLIQSRHPQQGIDATGMTTTTMMKMKTASCEELDNKEDPPSSVDTSAGSNQRRKLAAPHLNVSLDHSEGSIVSENVLDTEDEALDIEDELDMNIDELDSPDESDPVEFHTHAAPAEEYHQRAGAVAGRSETRQAAEESRGSRLWRSVLIGEQEHRIDMKCIEPYKRVISHGGYYSEQNAIIVFAACFLPDSDCDNYSYVMENLFLYVISTLELMVAEDYMIVYLNGGTPRSRMPGFTWMKKCYQMIDRRLKKNLKMFIIVHPSWFIRTLLGITRPFISSKFSSKIKYVGSLKELGQIIPIEYIHIPDSVLKYLRNLEETRLVVCQGLKVAIKESIRGTLLSEKTPD